MSIQRILPQHFFSYLMGKLGSIKRPVWLKNYLIRLFISRYQINLSEAIEKNSQLYPSFNDFFIRKLAVNARAIDTDALSIVSPVDGCISQMGIIQGNQLIQAKNHRYSLLDLFNHGRAYADYFHHGLFMTVYLSPKDYHRVHMPFGGRLLAKIAVPGKLFSVNPKTAQTVPYLFAQNERMITVFETEKIGKMAVIFVGAIVVGKIILSVSENTRLEKGDELGYFQLGSTVIILFEQNKIRFESDLAKNTSLKWGQKIGMSTVSGK